MSEAAKTTFVPPRETNPQHVLTWLFPAISWKEALWSLQKQFNISGNSLPFSLGVLNGKHLAGTRLNFVSESKAGCCIRLSRPHCLGSAQSSRTGRTVPTLDKPYSCTLAALSPLARGAGITSAQMRPSGLPQLLA